MDHRPPTSKINNFINWASAHFVLLAIIIAMGCAQPAEVKKPETGPKHVYKELKPQIYPVPEGVKSALPGLLNDNIYVYREIARTINLVAYVPDYKRESAIKMAAQAFIALTLEPALREDIDFWIIQIQPRPEDVPATADKDQPASKVVVWGVRPEEADAHKSSKDLAAFLETSEYLLVDDKIIAKGKQRLDEVPGIIPPAPEPGDTTQPPTEEREGKSPPKPDTETP